MANMVKIDFSGVDVNKPLPWPVYDGRGKMLLHKGYIIESRAQLDSLIERGMYRAQEASVAEDTGKKAKKLSPFTELDSLKEQLDKAYDEIIQQNAHGLQLIKKIATELQRLVEQDADACIGAVHLYATYPNHTQRALFYGLLCGLMAPSLGLDETGGHRLVIASLTSNLALRPYQDKLHNLNSNLTEKQRDLVERHPEQSAEMLIRIGETDNTLLDIIRQHHERGVGDGYPRQLVSEQIRPCAKLLLAVEHYVAKITGRAYRSACKTNEALRDLYRAAGHEVKEPIYLYFIKTLSVYPPGSFVRLKNGEIALITHRPKGNKQFLMKAIISPRGGAYMGSFKRDASLEEHKVLETVQPDHLPALNLPQLWDY